VKLLFVIVVCCYWRRLVLCSSRLHGSSKESRRFGGHRKISPQRYQKNYSPAILGL